MKKVSLAILQQALSETLQAACAAGGGLPTLNYRDLYESAAPENETGTDVDEVRLTSVRMATLDRRSGGSGGGKPGSGTVGRTWSAEVVITRLVTDTPGAGGANRNSARVDQDAERIADALEAMSLKAVGATAVSIEAQRVEIIAIGNAGEDTDRGVIMVTVAGIARPG